MLEGFYNADEQVGRRLYANRSGLLFFVLENWTRAGLWSWGS